MDKSIPVSVAYIASLSFMLLVPLILSWKLTLSFPVNDDIQDIIFFLISYKEADGVVETLSAFFQLHVEHITASSRIVYVSVLHFFGEIDFRAIAVYASIGKLVTIFILATRSKLGVLPALLILALLTLHPRAYDLIIWAMTGMAFYWSTAFTLISLWLLEKSGVVPFLGSVLFAFLAQFALSSGLLVWPIGLAYLLYLTSHDRDRPLAYVIIWTFIGVAAITLNQSLASSNNFQHYIAFTMDHPFYVFKFFITLLGSSLSFNNILVAQAMGALGLAGFLWSIHRGAKNTITIFHAFSLFLVLSLGLVAFARSSGSSMQLFNLPAPMLESALTPRYSYLSNLLYACLFLAWVENRIGAVSARLRHSILVFAAAYCALNYMIYTEELLEWREHQIKNYNKRGVVPIGYQKGEINEIMSKAEEYEIFVLPERSIPAKDK